ncbi:MAG TPA: MarR family transcriptional regulator [Pyrinomonadaceae bacterium]|nr:MarR family transcriptional regulator [Pyrinomonadaceae bacterium]
MIDDLKNGATIEEALVLTLLDLANQLNKLGEDVAANAGLTTQQWLVLLQIADDPNFPIPLYMPRRTQSAGTLASDIALARGVSRASVSVIVTQLMKLGLVRQEEEQGDRRHKRLFLTESGQQTIAALEEDRKKANRELFVDLDESELDALLVSLRKCLGRLWAVGNAGVLYAKRGL